MWISLWRKCSQVGFNGLEFKEWPDGKSLMEQPNVTVVMFHVIAEQAALEAKQGG